MIFFLQIVVVVVGCFAFTSLVLLGIKIMKTDKEMWERLTNKSNNQ